MANENGSFEEFSKRLDEKVKTLEKNVDKNVESLRSEVKDLDNKVGALKDEVLKQGVELKTVIERLTDKMEASSSRTITNVWVVAATVLALIFGYFSFKPFTQPVDHSAVIQQSRLIQALVQETVKKEFLANQLQNKSEPVSKNKSNSATQ